MTTDELLAISKAIMRCEEYDMCSWCPYAKACAELVDKTDEQQSGMPGRGLSHLGTQGQ